MLLWSSWIAYTNAIVPAHAAYAVSPESQAIHAGAHSPWAGRFQHLYGRANGWRNPRFAVEELRVESAFISSMHTFKADALSWEGGGELIAVGTSDGIEVRPQ